MRDLTLGEIDSWYHRGKWPCCGGTEYLAGPRGGAAMNIKCPKCGTRMNVTDPEAGFYLTFGQMIEEPPGYTPPPDPTISLEKARTIFDRIKEWFRGR